MNNPLLTASENATLTVQSRGQLVQLLSVIVILIGTWTSFDLYRRQQLFLKRLNAYSLLNEAALAITLASEPQSQEGLAAKKLFWKANGEVLVYCPSGHDAAVRNAMNEFKTTIKSKPYAELGPDQSMSPELKQELEAELDVIREKIAQRLQ